MVRSLDKLGMTGLHNFQPLHPPLSTLHSQLYKNSPPVTVFLNEVKDLIFR